MTCSFAARLFGSTMIDAAVGCFAALRRFATFFGTHALPERFHQIYNIRRACLFGTLYLFTLLLFTQKLFQRIFITILEFLWIKLTPLGFDDVRSKLKHILRHL